jgi:methionyl-tRNA formyltransferase
VVATRDGAIELLEIQQEGKKKLPIHEFLRGYRLASGDMLI